MTEITFAQQINKLSARMGTECKTLHKNVGTLGSLATDDKTSVVNAINEINGKVGKGTAGDVSYGQYEYATVEDAQNALDTFKASVGDTSMDFVAAFEAALA